MRVFLTGATGFIGSAIVQELTSHGHDVLGLARSDASAEKLARIGIACHRGALEDPDSLAAAARACDGVIHTAFIHDFKDIPAAGRTDRAAIAAIGAALAGTGKPLVVTSGLAHLTPGQIGTEDMPADPASGIVHRIPSEDATLALAAHGVRASLIRLAASVHGDGDYAFVPALIGIARAKAVAATIGAGLTRWPAVHRLDAARLFRLALEHGDAGARYHGVGDQGITQAEIAAVIARKLNVPLVRLTAEDAAAHFGWLAHFLAIDMPASSALTQQRLGWQPVHPGLIEDLQTGRYFAA